MSFTPEQKIELGALMREVVAEAIPVIIEQVVEAVRALEPKRED